MKTSTFSPGTLARALVIALVVALSAGVAAAGGGSGSNQIKQIKVSQKANRTTVTVVGTSRPTYTAFKLSTPKRLVVDLANSTVKGVPSVVDADTSLIDGVAVSEFSTGGVSVARVMVNFKKEAGYRVSARGNDLVITMTGGPSKGKAEAKVKDGPPSKEAIEKIAMARKEAELAKSEAAQARSEAAAAKSEASAAKGEAEKARAEAERARSKWNAAESRAERADEERSRALAQLQEIRDLSARKEIEARKARKEAAAAQASLDKALASREAKRSAQSRKLAKVERDAGKKIEDLEHSIARANEVAKREREKREALEAELEALDERLREARLAKEAAESIKEAAVASAEALKRDAMETTAAAGKARKEARLALEAQREAARRYDTAAKAERAKLLADLKQRERDSVEAKRRLAKAEANKDRTEKKLGDALTDMKEASRRLKKAQAQQRAMERKAKREIARSEKKRKEAERALEAVEDRAGYAARALRSARAEMERTLKAERARSAKAKEKADARIALAEKRVKESRAALSQANRKLEGLKKKAASAQAQASAARDKAAKAKVEIAAAKARAEKAERQASVIEKELAEAKQQIKGQEKKFAAAEEKLSEARGKIASQQRKIDELEALNEKAEKGKLTQEELRLLRLAEMRGVAGAGKAEQAEKKAAPAKESGSTITNIEFANSRGKQKIIITSDGPIAYRKSRGGKSGGTIVFDDTKLGPMLERTLDVSDFGGAVQRISSYKEGGKVKLDVVHGHIAANTVNAEGNTIEWVFTSDKANSGKVKPLGTDARTVIREDDSAYEYSVDRTAAYSVALKKAGTKKKRFTGRRIDLDFKDADIHNILRLLSDVGHVNIVTADDVSGSVTIRMRNVPWDQALDVILQAKKLGMVRDGNLIRVAPLATLEKEREMEIARRQQNKALEPLETRLIPVSYAQAGELQPRAQDLLSDRGKLSVDSRTNVIIARDTVSNLDQVEALIRNLDTQTPQVLIEGRIVEASSTYAREIGIQWGGDFSASSATANPTGLAFPSTVGVAGGATDNQAPVGGLSPVSGAKPNPNFAVNLPAAAGTGSGGALGITLGSIANNANLNLRLSAMEEEGTLRILSSPKILTLDNRQAHIEQGTLIPYSRISAQGIQTAFKEAKLNLTVTPHVTADGSVLLNMKMTRDEPDFNNKGARGDPTILKREAETELLVADGHTAVIGGIFTRNHGTSYKKVPFFGDIPILGWLFKNRSDSDRRSEMLIFITPRIVNRAESIGQ